MRDSSSVNDNSFLGTDYQPIDPKDIKPEMQ